MAHRARVRKELGGDAEWQKNYIAKASPMWMKQDNSLLALKQGAHLNTDVKPGGKSILTLVVREPDISGNQNPCQALSIGSTASGRKVCQLKKVFATFYTIDTSSGEENKPFCIF